VPAGSVGIGGAQTGIYPLETPGGWNLIGRTPLTLFSLQRDPPALLQVGDAVRFTAITPEEFARSGPDRS
jgi:inhibitor of KinA